MRYGRRSTLFESTKSTGKVINESGWVSVRKDANPNSSIVCFAKNGDPLTIKEYKDNYILAEFNGGQNVGYIDKKYVKVDNYISAAPAVKEEKEDGSEDS